MNSQIVTLERPAGSPPEGRRRLSLPPVGSTVLVTLFVVVLVIGGITTPGFLSIANAKSVMLTSSFVGIIALGMTVIMLNGNLFSLSLATTVAVSASMFLFALQWGVAPAILVSVALAAVLSWPQGLLVGGLRANPIIVTIAAGVIQEGLLLYATGGETVLPHSDANAYTFLNSRPLGIPFAFLVFLVLTAVVEFVLRRTRFGWQIFSLGENLEAARVAGFKITRITASVFMLAGACAGVAGVLLGAFNKNATLSIAGTYNFDAIAAVLVGGSLVTGGQGSASRTFFGAVFIAMLESLLLIHGYSTGVQLLIKGLLVFVVVCLILIAAKRGRA
jgi:ribose/xylose/arabinose/galactoside ABC-type transport system permease subunit